MMKKTILILILFLVTIWASEIMAQQPPSSAPSKEFTNPWVEALRYSMECMNMEKNGYDCKCVDAVRELVKSGEISKARGDLMIIQGCKKAPEADSDAGQNIRTYKCINGHVWQGTRLIFSCPWCGNPGSEIKTRSK